MRILVTGATGFIGGRTANALAEVDGHTVFATGRKSRPNHLNSLVHYETADLSLLEDCQRLSDQIDVVIHAAGLTAVWGDYQSFFRANVETTRHLLESSRKNSVQRFINISSPSIYFDFRDQLDLKEGDLPRHFSNNYARTKYEGEQLVQSFHRPDFLTVNLRPRLVVGAGDNNVIPRMIQLQKAGLLRKVGKGEHMVDITSMGNLLSAIQLCLTAPAEAMGSVYNISNGSPLRFWDFVDQVLKGFGISTKRRSIPFWPLFGLAKTNEWVCQLLNIKKEPQILPVPVAVMNYSMTLNLDHSRQHLGYEPTISNEEGIREFVDWWKDHETSVLS